MDYPKKFDKCPVCGSTSRVVGDEVMSEIEKGNISSDVMLSALVTRTPLYDPKNVILGKKQVPGIVALYDICSDCGTLYCTEVQKHRLIVEVQSRQRPEMPPFFGRG